MRAVVYKGPHEVAVEDKPYPKLQTETYLHYESHDFSTLW
jgi:hypothetical protein